MTKRVMSQNEITFTERNMEDDPSALAMAKELGYLQAPVVIAPDGTHWSGFQPERIKKLA